MLVARGRVDVADALRVGLQVQAVHLAEAIGDLRPRHQLSGGQAPRAQPSLRPTPRAALEHALGAEHRVQGVHPARDAAGDRLEVAVGDLAGGLVAAVQHDPHAEQVAAATNLVADPLDRGDPLL